VNHGRAENAPSVFVFLFGDATSFFFAEATERRLSAVGVFFAQLVEGFGRTIVEGGVVGERRVFSQIPTDSNYNTRTTNNILIPPRPHAAICTEQSCMMAPICGVQMHGMPRHHI
jgi:hypothetical protein